MTPWPCSCGAPGVRNVGTHGYCSACLGALFVRDAGGVFVHTPEVSWLWHHHGQNTSGRGDRWPGKPVFA